MSKTIAPPLDFDLDLKTRSQLVRFLTSSSCSLSPTMALQLGAGDGFNRDLGDQDGKLTFAEAVTQINGQKLIGPERRHLNSDRPVGDVTIRDLTWTLWATKLNSMQYADVMVNHKLNATQDFPLPLVCAGEVQ